MAVFHIALMIALKYSIEESISHESDVMVSASCRSSPAGISRITSLKDIGGGIVSGRDRRKGICWWFALGG